MANNDQTNNVTKLIFKREELLDYSYEKRESLKRKINELEEETENNITQYHNQELAKLPVYMIHINEMNLKKFFTTKEKAEKFLDDLVVAVKKVNNRRKRNKIMIPNFNIQESTMREFRRQIFESNPQQFTVNYFIHNLDIPIDSNMVDSYCSRYENL